MIYKGTNEITGIYHGSQEIIAVYHGKTLVWQIARSCFGRGYWDNTLGWNNNDGWKN